MCRADGNEGSGWNMRLPNLPARPERNGGKSTGWSEQRVTQPGERDNYGKNETQYIRYRGPSRK